MVVSGAYRPLSQRGVEVKISRCDCEVQGKSVDEVRKTVTGFTRWSRAT